MPIDAALLRAAEYAIAFLDTLPVPVGADPFGYDSFAYGINEQGVIVGESTLDRTGHIGQSRPVLWNGSSEAQELWDDQTFGGKGLGVNSAGYVVGRYGSGSGIPLPGPGIPDGGAFIWNPATRQFTDLGDFGGLRAEATGINDAGQVSGSAEALEVFDIDGTPTLLPVPRAFVWDADNGLRDLGAFPSQDGSRGAAINNADKVVGWSLMSDGTERAFIWDETNGIQSLASESSRAFAINDLNEVVGRLLGNGVSIPPRSFIWNEIVGLQLLPIEMGQPSDVNNRGQVIDHVGNIWDELHGMRRVADLIPAIEEWEISDLSAINDDGLIVGTAFNTVDGRFRGILLTPIPEPTTMSLCGIGVVVIAHRRYVAKQHRRG